MAGTQQYQGGDPPGHAAAVRVRKVAQKWGAEFASILRDGAKFERARGRVERANELELAARIAEAAWLMPGAWYEAMTALVDEGVAPPAEVVALVHDAERLPPIDYRRHDSGGRSTVPRQRVASRRPRLTAARSRERRPGTARTTTNKRTRTTSSAQSADPPAADPPSAADIDRGILLLGYWAAHKCQDRAYAAALVELEDVLGGDRLTDEDVDTYVEVFQYDWPVEYREEFVDWLGAEHADLFERPVNGRSRLVEPVDPAEYGPWREPTDDDSEPF